MKSDSEVVDLAAVLFSENFYYSLFLKQSIKISFGYAEKQLLHDPILSRFFSLSHLEERNYAGSIDFLLLPGSSPIHNQSLKFEIAEGEIELPEWENTNLPPTGRDEILGRSFDIFKINQQLFRGKRCVSIQGLGGMGKSLIAEAVGRWSVERERYQNGVWQIDCRNFLSGDEILGEIQETLSLHPKAQFGAKAKGAFGVFAKSILIILDDVDRIIEHDSLGLGNVAKTLLGYRKTFLLITSRKSIPATISHDSIFLERLEKGYTRRVFLKNSPPFEDWGDERFDLDIQNQLWDFLDGYPFPIRLAASYMKQRRCSIAELHDRLVNAPLDTLRYADLSGKEVINRENSLSSSLEISYRELPPDVQSAFVKLSYFPSGLTKIGIATIFGNDTLKAFEMLILYSMVEYSTIAVSRRFTLPEPARSFAQSKETHSDFEEHFFPVAFKYYRENIFSVDFDSLSKKERLKILEERHNLQAILGWYFKKKPGEEDNKAILYFAAYLCKNWILFSRSEETHAIDFLNTALLLCEETGFSSQKAYIFEVIGSVHEELARLEEAIVHYKKASFIYGEIGDNKKSYQLKKLEGKLKLILGDFTSAIESIKVALEFLRKTNPTSENLAIAYEELGDFITNYGNDEREATPYYEKAIEYRREEGLIDGRLFYKIIGSGIKEKKLLKQQFEALYRHYRSNEYWIESSQESHSIELIKKGMELNWESPKHVSWLYAKVMFHIGNVWALFPEYSVPYFSLAKAEFSLLGDEESVSHLEERIKSIVGRSKSLL